MIRRLPMVSTLIVLAAVAVMIGLGIWQIQRAQWKAQMLERYRSSQTMSAEIPWPQRREEVETALYRHSSVDCVKPLSSNAVSGRNADGQAGWAQVVRCRLAGGGEADIVLGWSERPAEPQWSGGRISGFVGPGRDGEARLIASPPQAGLQANAAPDPEELPNNHMSYAVQWFLFALTALAIYALALRKRWRGQ